MSINLTDEIEVKTKKGKLGAAKQIFLEGDTTSLQKAHEDNQAHFDTLDNRSSQMEESIKNISVTGGASVASAVTYDNTTSGLEAVNVKGAVDELATKNKSQNAEIAKKANTADVDTKFTEEKKRVDAELDEKFDKESVAQETGESKDKVISQKETSRKFKVLEQKLNNITDQTTEEEDDRVSFENNNGEEVASVDAEGIKAVSVKVKGKEVLTEQDLTNTASKSELYKKQDRITGFSQGQTNEDTEEQVWESDEDGNPEKYASIGNYGVKAKAYLDLNGNPIIGKKTFNKVQGATDLIDMHFNVKSILGNTFQTLVDFKDTCIYSLDYGHMYTPITLLASDMDDAENVTNFAYNKDNTISISASNANIGNFYLVKTPMKLLSMSRYIKLHVKSFKGEIALGTYYAGNNKNTWGSHHGIFTLSSDGSLYAQHGTDKSSTNPKYFNTDRADNWEMPAKEFDLYLCKSGTGWLIFIDYDNEKKYIGSYSFGYGDLKYESYDNSYVCFGVRATDETPVLNVSSVEIGVWSGIANGADCKAVRYKNGEIYRDAEGNVYVASTQHSHDSYNMCGGTNIWKLNIRSHKIELVGVIDGHYTFKILQADVEKWISENSGKTETDFNTIYSKWDGVDIICNMQSTCIIVDEDKWLVSSSVFSAPMDRILVQCETTFNPLFGHNSFACKRIDGMTINDYDLDTLYDGKKWIGISGGGSKWHCDTYEGKWVKDATNNTFEGSMFVIINGKMLYTSSPANNKSLNVYDYATHEQIGVVNFDIFSSNGETSTVTPAWGHIFGICENGVTRYYAVIFSTRRYRNMSFGYGDMWIYEATEIANGVEKIY